MDFSFWDINILNQYFLFAYIRNLLHKHENVCGDTWIHELIELCDTILVLYLYMRVHVKLFCWKKKQPWIDLEVCLVCCAL